MREKRNIFFVVVFAVFLFSCNKEKAWDCVKSTGEITTEIRKITVFDKIVLNDNIDVFLIADTSNFVEIKAGKNIIPKIETTVENNALIIKNNNKCNWVRSYETPIEVYVHYLDIHYIEVRGVGDLVSTNLIQVDSLRIDAWESVSSIDIDVDCQYFSSGFHTGTADLTISGTANQAYFYINPNAYLNALAFESNYLSITSSSPSECYLHSNASLNVVINYLGNIYYKGTPQTITLEENHDGKLIEWN